MKCPKCGQLADPFATKCPHCGPIEGLKSGKKSAPVKPTKELEFGELDSEAFSAPTESETQPSPPKPGKEKKASKPEKQPSPPKPAKEKKASKKEKPTDSGDAPSGKPNFLSGLLSKLKPKSKAQPPAESEEELSIDEPG